MGGKKSKFQRQIFSLIVLLSIEVNSSSPELSIKNHKTHFENIAMTLWENAELGYQEEKSSLLLSSTLEKEGFKVSTGVAGIPTAFIAEYGSSGPVIGILGEFDALPGLAQTISPFREKAVNETGAGQACGHHLFGAGSAWAAVAIKEWLESNNFQGRIRFYGTPAEEGGSGKVYMVREGLFNDVDIVLHWHPDDVNSANPAFNNSNKSAKFSFKGISTHAAGAPELGRSALDGVESMNMMVNMMREHIPQESRIHYVITKGGLAPNVVPEEAEVYYYVRHPKMDVVESLFQRVLRAAEGAALGTETKITYEVMHGNYSLLPNLTLQKLIHKNLMSHGGISYTDQELEYAKSIAKTLVSKEELFGQEELIQPFQKTQSYGSTDVGDISWNVPTAGFRASSWVPGTSAHSWQAVASGGTSIGLKGAELAAKTLTSSAIELFKSPELIEEAKKEHKANTGNAFNYVPLLGDRDPPLDYRK
ncbi:amidohydrolase [Gammaproteobacteria bacterium]|nr:amidohydrolase [Gammaproteobacteria bacterium]